jgi:hypothetical protein
MAATDASLHLYALPTNRGFCGGHNYALNHITTELVMLVNPDVEMAPITYSAPWPPCTTTRILTRCGGLLLQTTKPDPRIDCTYMVRCTGERFGLRLHRQRLREVAFLALKEVARVNGAQLMMRSRYTYCLKVEGTFFNPRFFAHK